MGKNSIGQLFEIQKEYRRVLFLQIKIDLSEKAKRVSEMRLRTHKNKSRCLPQWVGRSAFNTYDG